MRVAIKVNVKGEGITEEIMHGYNIEYNSK